MPSVDLRSVTSSKDPALEALAKLQLSAPVGVRVPSSSKEAEPDAWALWKSPKSPKESKELSAINSSVTVVVLVVVANVKGSVPLAAAESENGPKASYRKPGVT